jgi:hypothetical protein
MSCHGYSIVKEKFTNLDSMLVGAKTAYWQHWQENTVWCVSFQHVSVLVEAKTQCTGNPVKKTLFGTYHFKLCLCLCAASTASKPLV